MQSQLLLQHKPNLSNPVRVRPTAQPNIRHFIRNSVVTPVANTVDVGITLPQKDFRSQAWNGGFLATSLSLVWAVSQVDLEIPVVLGIVAAAVLTESQGWIEPLKNILSLGTSQNGVTYKDQIIEGQLVSAFKPSKTQDTEQEQTKTEEISEELEEEEWMDLEVPPEVTEEYQEEPATVPPVVKKEEEKKEEIVEEKEEEEEEKGSQNDKEMEGKVFDMQDYEKAKEPEPAEVQPTATHSIVIGYETTWPKAILHGSVSGGDWGDLAECEEEKSFTVNVDSKESESVPLLEFVLTDGNEDWDHSCDGENYFIYKAGQYQLKDGVLTSLE